MDYSGKRRREPKPKPRPTPQPSNYVSLSAGEAAIHNAADDVGDGMQVNYGYDYLGSSLSSCGQYNGGVGVFCEVRSDFLNLDGSAFSCSSQARATNDGVT